MMKIDTKFENLSQDCLINKTNKTSYHCDNCFATYTFWWIKLSLQFTIESPYRQYKHKVEKCNRVIIPEPVKIPRPPNDIMSL